MLAWLIARKDLSLRIRDKSVIIIGVVAPLVLAFIFNAVFGSAFSDAGVVVTIPVGVVDEDGGNVAAAFGDVVASLENEGLLEVTRYGSPDEARAAVEDGEVSAAYVLPAGLSQQANAGDGGAIQVIGDVDSPTAVAIASAIADRFTVGVEAISVAIGAGIGTGVITPADIPSVLADAGAITAPAEVRDITAETRQLDSATYFVAGLSVFFMFFIAGLGTTSMLEERTGGTLGRLLAAPLRARTVLLGKALASIVLAFGSMAVLMVASTLIMGADWGPPIGALAMIGAAVLAAVSIMSVVGSAVKSAEQAGNLQSIVGVAFAMLGGTFVPISQDGGWLARLSLATPNAWFLRGLADMSGGSVAEGLPAIGVLLGMAALFLVVGLPLVGRTVKP